MATQKFIMQNGQLVYARSGLFRNYASPNNTPPVLSYANKEHRSAVVVSTGTVPFEENKTPAATPKPGALNTKLLIGGGVGIIVIAGIIYFATRKKAV